MTIANSTEVGDEFDRIWNLVDCPSCGKHLPKDSVACNGCGVKIAVVAYPGEKPEALFANRMRAGRFPDGQPEWRKTSDPTSGTITGSAAVFVNWADLWAGDHDDSEWVEELILARGRGHAFYAGHKTGKSLLMLWLAAKLATGPDKVVVIYLDYEMTEDDLRERLEDMGYSSDSDLSRLRYALLPSLGPLDRSEGAQALVAIVDQTIAAHPDHHVVVIIDTISRAVQGEENSADTFRDFYAATGIRLKQRGVTWARLDHAGKDPGAGQRGSSGKGDDVDVIWKVEKTDSGLRLKRDAARMRWVPERVDLQLLEEPTRFVKVTAAWPAGTKDAAATLDELGLPMDVYQRAARAALNAAGVKMRNTVLTAALRYRRESAAENRESLGNRSSDDVGNRIGNRSAESGHDQHGNRSGIAGNRSESKWESLGVSRREHPDAQPDPESEKPPFDQPCPDGSGPQWCATHHNHGDPTDTKSR